MRAEAAVRARAERLPVTIVRPSAVYGEGERDISQSFPLAAHRLQPVVGLRSKHTVMVYVGDLVKGIVDVALEESAVNQIYFLNHPEVVTTREVIKAVGEAMGKSWGIRFPVPILFMRLAAPLAEWFYQIVRGRPAITRDKVRELAQRHWLSDSSRAERDFGWRAEHDLLRGMRRTTRGYLETQRELSEMPLEREGPLWMKYWLSGTLLGGVVEALSAWGGVAQFEPPWAVYLVVLGYFGLVLGSLANLLRRKDVLVQFLAGGLLQGALELLNGLELMPLLSWHYAPGWPFGVTSVWARAAILSLTGALFVVAINAWMRYLYKRRLRLG
jgi:hypothetical protein